MKRYILTSSKFKGEIVYEFDNDGDLSLFDVRNAELTKEQKTAIYNCVPMDSESVPAIKTEHSTITEIMQEVTFEDFWRKYNDKLRSSRKRTAAKWNKMSTGEQVKAYNYIQKYFNSIPHGVEKKYAETYLNAELWNN